MATTSTSDSWRGAPFSDICGSQSPWGIPEFPLITPAYNHAVLYHISGDHKDSPPIAQHGHDKWDKDFVRMPCSNSSLYPVVGENGESTLKKRWDLIEQALQKPIKNTEDLAAAILSYNTNFISIWKFTALHKLFDDYLEEEESEYFFSVTLPQIAKLALSLPKLIQSPIPLLKKHRNRAVSLSQQQVSCLLANAFFCTFPRRNSRKHTSEYASFPSINFNMLYERNGTTAVLEKLKSICHYFRRVCTKVPLGVMTFIRRTIPPENCPKWGESSKFVGGTPVHVDSKGIIEDADGLIQIDFANKFLGGGVLGGGCVQEEIRFVICPELMISMLFTEVLTSTESLMMIGCERYSNYTGYGNTFHWAGDYEDSTPFDSSRRRRCAVLAMDALPFRRNFLQYQPPAIRRELNKAWVGYSTFLSEDDDRRLNYPGVATGNWGCGAFGGNAYLKSLIQLMACTEAKRPMAYYTFGDVTLRNDFINMYNLLSKYNITIGQLFEYLIKFAEYINTTDKYADDKIHAYLHQLIVDNKTVEKMETSQDSIEGALLNQNSPDPFEDDIVFDSSGGVEAIQVKHNKKSSPKGRQQTKKPKPETPKPQTKALKSHKLIQISTLFDEMTNFDNENGRLNLSTGNKSILENSELESNETTSENKEGHKGATKFHRIGSPESSKKKVGKKITDYFNKKT